ncbi:MAG: glycosyltransferase family 9 protein [Bacteroidales bacterium]|nr:glycosyltransferase family 9 protein [Bacteroidota bacterium]MBL6950157.1 glycosyltransferase family 9 protein [Bacteroidales bacterium]
MKKILVIQTASIGDVILATAVLEKLRHYFPDAGLDFMVKKGMEELFRDHPFLNHVVVWDKSGKQKEFLKLIKQIRKEHYDLVVDIQRFTRTGLLTVLSRAKESVGFNKNPLSSFFTKSIPHEIGPDVHETDRNQKLIADITDEMPEKPRLYPKEIPDAGYQIPDKIPPKTSSGIRDPASGIYYTISPASLWFTKQFPAEKWVELISKIPPEATVYLLGSKADFDLCEKIQHPESGIRYPACNIINLAGEISLLESAALMKQAKMNFTNDSAPMHLASAVNAPVTVVYCSTTPDFGFGPLSDDAAVIQVTETLTCRPCGLHGLQRCPYDHFNCAMQIELSQLVSRI